jgi:hypothetical protein
LAVRVPELFGTVELGNEHAVEDVALLREARVVVHTLFEILGHTEGSIWQEKATFFDAVAA